MHIQIKWSLKCFHFISFISFILANYVPHTDKLHSEETAEHTEPNNNTNFGSVTLSWIMLKEIQKRVKVVIVFQVIWQRAADIEDRSARTRSLWFGCMVLTEDTVWATSRKVMITLYVSSPGQYISKAETPLALPPAWFSIPRMDLSHLKVSNICPQCPDLEIKQNLRLCVLILWPGCHMKRLEGSSFQFAKFNSQEIIHFAAGSTKQTSKTNEYHVTDEILRTTRERECQTETVCT